jgi:hypothetical protein
LQQQQDRPIKYGDVFDVSGELAAQPVEPKDAALLQSAEDIVQGLGHTQKGGPAAVMQSAATLNVPAGHVGRAQLSGPIPDAGVAVTKTELPAAASSPSPSQARSWDGLSRPRPRRPRSHRARWSRTL